jgi:hypothetical protein
LGAARDEHFGRFDPSHGHVTANPEHLLRLGADRGTNEPTPECIDDETVAALAEGALDGTARDAALAHVATCARCRRAVSSVARVLADPAVSREARATARPRLRPLTLASGIAAAAIVAFVALPWRAADDTSTHRAPTITATASPVLMSPVGVVADARTLRWTGVGGTDRYRVTLFDATGGVVFETQTTDTLVTIPGSVRLERAQGYFWKVEARTGWNRWSASEMVEFSVR